MSKQHSEPVEVEVSCLPSSGLLQAERKPTTEEGGLGCLSLSSSDAPLSPPEPVPAPSGVSGLGLGVGFVQLAFSGWRPEILLNILQYTGQPPQQRLSSPKCQ